DLVEDLSRQVGEGGNEINRAGGMVLGWHNHALTELEPRLRKDVRRLRRAKPFWPRVALPPKVDVPATHNQSLAGRQGPEGAKDTSATAVTVLEDVHGAGSHGRGEAQA